MNTLSSKFEILFNSVERLLRIYFERTLSLPPIERRFFVTQVLEISKSELFSIDSDLISRVNLPFSECADYQIRFRDGHTALYVCNGIRVDDNLQVLAHFVAYDYNPEKYIYVTSNDENIVSITPILD